MMKIWATSIGIATFTVLVILATLMHTAPLQAAGPDGHFLADKCNAAIEYMGENTEDTELVDVMFCLGYVSGVRDGVLAMPTRGKKPFCIPEGDTNRESVKIVADYLKNNPKLMEEPASKLIIDAHSESNPCDDNDR